ncbi:MAG: DUF1049 domain-containing protein [Clostridia bacterium]|nr:MAG: DUF1049 domain-containing protein [Clostridia bacterium]
MLVLLFLVFALLVAIFAVQNAGTVDLHFLGWDFPGISLAYVILASLIAGGLLVFILTLGRRLRLRRQLKLLLVENDNLARELNRLKQASWEDTQPLLPVKEYRD